MGRDPCKDVLKNLHRILDEEPSGSLCEKIQTHLKQCVPCTKRYEELESLIALCNRFPPEQIAEDRKRLLKEKLRTALAKQKTRA